MGDDSGGGLPGEHPKSMGFGSRAQGGGEKRRGVGRPARVGELLAQRVEARPVPLKKLQPPSPLSTWSPFEPPSAPPDAKARSMTMRAGCPGRSPGCPTAARRTGSLARPRCPTYAVSGRCRGPQPTTQPVGTPFRPTSSSTRSRPRACSASRGARSRAGGSEVVDRRSCVSAVAASATAAGDFLVQRMRRSTSDPGGEGR